MFFIRNSSNFEKLLARREIYSPDVKKYMTINVNYSETKKNFDAILLN